MSEGRIIENVTLVEIEPRDGAQLYQWGNELDECLWLSGWNCASNVKVGDKGRLVYRSTPSRGLYFFEKDEEKSMEREECDECGAEVLSVGRRDELRKKFEDAHKVGANKYGGLWLVANNAAIGVAANLGIDASEPRIRALLSMACLRILGDTQSQ